MDIVIIGCGGMGRETLSFIQAHNEAGRTPEWRVRGFLTNEDELYGTKVNGVQVIGSVEWLHEGGDVFAVCAIGSPRARRELTRQLSSWGVRFATVVHPSATVGPDVYLGAGTIVGAHAVLTTNVDVGDHVIVNVKASVSHDSKLDDFVTLAPGVTIAGRVIVEYGADLGVNCSVLPGVQIGRGAVIGAGAVVNRDIEHNRVAIGVPARTLRTLPKEDWL